MILATVAWLWLAPTDVVAPATSDARRALDWTKPNRWIHVDSVPLAGTTVFEAARQRWLVKLRRGDGALPDGRALFWSGDRGGVRTYVTLYPFGEWADLDARARVVAETQDLVGKPAVTDYDSADVVLVAPHYSQVWRRSPEDDFVSPLAGAISELDAGAGRLQLDQLDLAHGDRAHANWTEIRTALATERYPLTCRVYSQRFGLGQTVRLWLAPDRDALRRAPPLADVLRKALGARGTALAQEYARLWSAQQELDLVRREDLSNLEQPAGR